MGVVVFVALLYAILLLDDPAVRRHAHQPDGIVQNGGAAALLTASIFFGVAFARSRRPLLALMSIAFFFGAGEEASWGQFILGFDPPEAVRERNAQNEFTVHNLDLLQDIERSLGIDLVFTAFLLCTVGFTIIIPLIAARSSEARRRLERWVPIVPGVFGALVVLNIVLLAIASALSGPDRSHAVTEVGEAGLSVLFVAIAAHFAVSLARPGSAAAPRRRTPFPGPAQHSGS